MGPEGGHTLQAKEISRLVAPFRARYYCPDDPQATQTSGLCTLGFAQFKADGLVEVSDLVSPADIHFAAAQRILTQAFYFRAWCGWG